MVITFYEARLRCVRLTDDLLVCKGVMQTDQTASWSFVDALGRSIALALFSLFALPGCPPQDDTEPPGGPKPPSTPTATPPTPSAPSGEPAPSGSAPPTEEFKERKPDWWPDKPQPPGIPWPPPKPEGWAPEKPWPPLKETGSDPQFWVDLYGEGIDTEKDDRFKKKGSAGNKGFPALFKDIYSFLPEAPGCGLYTMVRWELERIASCDPYPEALTRQLCAKAFNKKTAENYCIAICAKNERECRQARIFTPPVEMNWECFSAPCDLDPCEFLVSCEAKFICDCFEN